MQSTRLGKDRWFLRLDPGEELLGVLKAFCAEQRVTAGFVTGLGSTASAVLSLLDPASGEYLKRRFDEPMEVGNLTGTVSVGAADGRPFVHVHAVLAPRELIAYSGHLHEARVGAVLEVLLEAFDARLERHVVPDKPFPWLILPGERPAADTGDAGA